MCVCDTVSYIKSAACLSKLTITNKSTLETDGRKGVCVDGGSPHVSALSRPHGGFQKLNERLLQLRYSVRTAKKDCGNWRFHLERTPELSSRD